LSQYLDRFFFWLQLDADSSLHIADNVVHMF
jgi:hypothetical protein